MKRFFAGTAAALLAAVLILPREARAVCAEKAFSLDAVSGRVLFDKNADILVTDKFINYISQ